MKRPSYVLSTVFKKEQEEVNTEKLLPAWLNNISIHNIHIL